MAARISPFGALLRRERLVAAACLAAVIALSWTYVLKGGGTGMPAIAMTGAEPAMDMPSPPPWTAGHAAIMLSMWWVMMVAMMLPSAAPMILLYDAFGRKSGGERPAPLAAFVSAYVIVWGVFSLAAVAAQWLLERSGLLSGTMRTTSVLLGAGLLIGAGFWQLTPLKAACLRHCRSPAHFLAASWRPGAGGAFRMGVEHGVFCVGCCWVLMALLFYGGVMDLRWIAGLAAYVLVEKLAPAGHWIGRAAGLLLVAWGVAVGLAAWAAR